ncbi:Vid27 family protein [Schizosaccharomyces cryophilus OY26]|uniref:Vid27 family protein n=1 Tax=Schizosaccharomyces cryophilus (strain OY26 / ATCC MYA-4695 / CBS 11777 / NBRC 106824 / NRRL Y48691) TaxID=653667 RepID=S9VW88_SCHCR|nr:Vid27 family protein [Schizosaccharomyces cryophilus OY26]EPY50504.1 Vid27 family protein [Schizosaccharomyces cryophilus OY26]
MFMLKSLGKYIWGNSTSSEIVQIPYGQLYSVHNDFRECMFKDASASIRRSTAEYQYQLVIQRAYEEGEEVLEGDGSDEVEDEQAFLLDERLNLRFEVKKDGISMMWDNPEFQDGTLYEFTCEEGLQEGVAYTFEMVALQCMYERKYRQPHSKATLADLEQFSVPIKRPHSSNDSLENIITKLDLKSEDLARRKSRQLTQDELDELAAQEFITSKPQASEVQHSREASERLENKQHTPKVVDLEKEISKEGKTELGTEEIDGEEETEDSFEGELMGFVHAELYLFDSLEEIFVLQSKDAEACIYDLGDWNYWFTLTSKERKWLKQSVESKMNPVFSFEHLSFIWNYYDEIGTAFSWLLRFSNQEEMDKFQKILMRALWENLNQQKWLKIKDDEREYVRDAFYEDDEMPDAESEEDEEAMRRQLQLGDSEEESEYETRDSFTEFSESEESEIDESRWRKETENEKNSILAVGYKNDRSYVARNNRIGVFKHVDDGLKFDTSINNLSKPNGKPLQPSKILLHNQDSSIVFQTEDSPHHLYHMDVEYGKVVDEWKIHEDVPLVAMAPDNKFAQMTAEKTLVGLSNNSIFRIDPRVEGNKLVAEEFKQYATRNHFSTAATTEKGYIAVASDKGDIRLFDRLGINAKTALPALGEPIIGIDVTADGNWVLATCKTYLLLIDARIKEGRNAGKLGFERSFNKDSKPKPKRLQLSPQHVAMMQGELEGGVSFTTAKFNTGIDAQETSIISSVGPYLISWNLDFVKRGKTDKYKIRRYQANIQAEDFRFGTDKNMIVALPNDVTMIDKSSLRRPTRASICTPASKLPSRSNIVNEPY